MMIFSNQILSPLFHSTSNSYIQLITTIEIAMTMTIIHQISVQLIHFILAKDFHLKVVLKIVE